VKYERLDKVLVYKKCNGRFLFETDVKDHPAFTGHTGTFDISLVDKREQGEYYRDR
jgi:hypothetical protein